MKNQLFLQSICDLNGIIELARLETISNIDLYVSFLVQGTHADLLSQMNMYLYEKCYNTPNGDMMPLVLCNALRLNLIIIGQTENGYDIGKVVCDFPNTSDKCLLVHNYKEHYDGITIKALIPKANTANETVVLSTRPPSISNINPFPDGWPASECAWSLG